jgi:probable F420-dependent oxidoreductase
LLDGGISDHVMSSRSIALAEPQTLAEIRSLATLVEDVGYEGLWLAETSGPDVMVTAGVIAAATQTLRLGTLITSVYTRTPAVLAMAAATVADVAGRTFRLGLGTGGQAMVQNWHGQSFRRPLARIEQTVEVIRAALAGEKTSSQGDVVSSVGFRLLRDGQAPVELHLAALGDRMLELAASVADGVLLTWLPPSRAPAVIRTIRAAAARAGRNPDSVKVSCRVLVAVTDDPAAAIARIPETISPYLTSPPYRRFFADHGFTTETQDFSTAFERHDRRASLAAISESMSSQLVIAGDASTCEAALSSYIQAGADELIIAPFAQLGFDSVRQTIEALAPRNPG